MLSLSIAVQTFFSPPKADQERATSLSSVVGGKNREREMLISLLKTLTCKRGVASWKTTRGEKRKKDAARLAHLSHRRKKSTLGRSLDR